MRPPIDYKERKLRSQFGNLSNGLVSRQPPKAGSSWLRTLGRALRDNGALIAAILALIGVLIAQIVTTNNTERGLATQRELEESRSQTQQQMEEDRAREAELQTYLDDMGAMLLDEDSPLPKAEPGGPMSSLARAKTATILERLDAQRKKIVLQFLYESQLIQKAEPVVSLRNADLTDADLRNVDLTDANLRNADLNYADLSDAHLHETDLTDANLRNADLTDADLRGASLTDAKLTDAHLRGANLQGATLEGAILLYANLQYATLSEADLRGGNLHEAILPMQGQIEQAIGDEHTILPEGIDRPKSWSARTDE